VGEEEEVKGRLRTKEQVPAFDMAGVLLRVARLYGDPAFYAAVEEVCVELKARQVVLDREEEMLERQLAALESFPDDWGDKS